MNMPITPMRQMFEHKPNEGQFGDCQRTAMAMVLGMKQTDVPNFGEYYSEPELWAIAMTEFLDEWGLFSIDVPMLGSTPMEDAIRCMRMWTGNQPFIFSGRSVGGTNHAVVIDHTGIMIDPAGRAVPLVGPGTDGYWWFQAFGVKVGQCVPTLKGKDPAKPA